MKIIQIVPRLPPAINGLGDYALNLARQLNQDFHIKTHFVVGNPDWNGLKEIEGFSIKKVEDRSSEALASLLSQLAIDKVLLHYVGYGYAQRGCPVWLIEGLKLWHQQKPERKILTMFHEVYASSYKPWTSSFWSSPLQKNLASRLAKLSDGVMTNTQAYAEMIANLGIKKHLNIPVIPVFSNIGEPIQVKPLSERKPWLVVFGNVNNRRRIFTESKLQLNWLCQALAIEKIIDIGSSTGLTLSTINNIPIQEMGKQPAKQISSILLNSCAGFFSYNPDLLAKSTIFAAYCAHGLLPVSTKSSNLQIDGINSEKHYLAVNEVIQDFRVVDKLQEIADNACAWYQNHNLLVQAKLFASQLRYKI
ncbi:unknown protein [Stanieria sp. NIES-3757]|nr:unknown protein [Stanieria sp. NIES-3757]